MLQKSKTRYLFPFLIAIPLFVGGVTIFAIDGGPEYENGIWVESDVQDCSDGLVCTEWEVRGEPTNDPPCCQEANNVGSTSFHACGATGEHFRH